MSRSLELLTDLCLGLSVRAQRMFGGYGFFAPNGGMFAGIVTDDDIILKLADEQARAELVALGGHAWVYDEQDKPMTMAQWIVVPERFYDDHETFRAWLARAHALAPPKLAKLKRGKPRAVKKGKKKPTKRRR